MKIYVANLKMYNMGRLVGKWIELPCDNLDEQLNLVLTNFGKLPDGYCEEVAIHDYEAPMSIGEYDDINELNELAELIDSTGYDEEVIEALFEVTDTEYAKNKLENNEFYYVTNVFNYRELAEKMDEEMLPFDYSIIKGTSVESYIDWEMVGRDLDYSGTWYIAKNHVAIHVW